MRSASFGLGRCGMVERRNADLADGQVFDRIFNNLLAFGQ